MKLNQKTIDEIKQSEGLRLQAYPDPGSKNGLPVTIGYGTTKINGKNIKLGTVITKEQAEKYFKSDLEKFADQVLARLKVPVNDNQLGALTSFSYNIGIGAFENSTLLKKLNAGDYKAVPAQMRRWNKNDGKVMQGLVNRREREIELWNTPSKVVISPVDGSKPPVPHTPSPEKRKGLLELLIEFIVGLFKRSR